MAEENHPEEDPPRKILILYTGGTIGMKMNEDDQLVPIPGYLEHQVRVALKGAQMDVSTKGRGHILHMPEFDLYSYDPLIDSAEMQPNDWTRIAKDIAKNHRLYDGTCRHHSLATSGPVQSACFVHAATRPFERSLSERSVFRQVLLSYTVPIRSSIPRLLCRSC